MKLELTDFFIIWCITRGSMANENIFGLHEIYN